RRRGRTGAGASPGGAYCPADRRAPGPLPPGPGARLIGLPGKVGVDGSQVEGLYRAGKLDAIKSYCLADVAQTGLLFLRFRLLQGTMSPVEYRRCAAELMEALRADARLADVMRQIDGERLLLAA